MQFTDIYSHIKFLFYSITICRYFSFTANRALSKSIYIVTNSVTWFYQHSMVRLTGLREYHNATFLYKHCYVIIEYLYVISSSYEFVNVCHVIQYTKCGLLNNALWYYHWLILLWCIQCSACRGIYCYHTHSDMHNTQCTLSNPCWHY